VPDHVDGHTPAHRWSPTSSNSGICAFPRMLSLALQSAHPPWRCTVCSRAFFRIFPVWGERLRCGTCIAAFCLPRRKDGGVAGAVLIGTNDAIVRSHVTTPSQTSSGHRCAYSGNTTCSSRVGIRHLGTTNIGDMLVVSSSSPYDKWPKFGVLSKQHDKNIIKNKFTICTPNMNSLC
jgi:hypothetical protein